jgi:hypothetical protein
MDVYFFEKYLRYTWSVYFQLAIGFAGELMGVFFLRGILFIFILIKVFWQRTGIQITYHLYFY